MIRASPKFYFISGLWKYDGLEFDDFVFEKYPSFKKIAGMARRGLETGMKSLMIQGKVLKKPTARLFGTADHWPAVIRPGKAGAPLAFRKDVAQMISSSPLTGFEFRPLRLKGFTPRRLWLKRYPGYCLFQPMGRMETSLRVYSSAESPWRFLGEARDFSDFALKSIRRNPPFEHRLMPAVESWNGNDAIALPDSSCGEFLATLEFVELIRNSGWRGFAAHPMDACRSLDKDVLDLPWPPSQWYPVELPD